MLRIRLSRRGAKKDPHYRVVVTDQKVKRDGRFVEIVGFYNPALKPVRLNLDLERVRYWVGQGAQPTPTVKSLMRRVEEAVPAAVQPEAAGSSVEADEKAAHRPEVTEGATESDPPEEAPVEVSAEEA